MPTAAELAAQGIQIDPHTGQPIQWEAARAPSMGMVGVNPQSIALLKSAGLWKPEYDAAMPQPQSDVAGRAAANREWQESPQYKEIVASLAGLSQGQSRQDYQLTDYLRDPSGKVVGQNTFKNVGDSLRTNDYLSMAAVVGGGLAAGSALGAAGYGANVGLGSMSAGATSAGFGAGGLSGAGSAAVGAGATAGKMTAEQAAIMAANGMTDAQIAAAATAMGDTAMAANFAAGAGYSGAAAAGAGALTPTGTEAGIGALPEVAGANLATVGAGAGAAAAGGGAAAAAAGAGGMNAGNWIQLAGMGLGAIGAKNAGDNATDAANRATDAARASADATAALGREQLDFTKTQYYDSKPQRDAAAATALEVSKAQLASQQQQDALAAEYANYNRTTFRPLEQGIVKGAQEYDTPEKRAAAAASAIADVDMGMAATQQSRARQLAANGVNPGSAKAMSIMGSMGLDQARSGAGAAYQARKGVEADGYSRQVNAASLGRNLPANQNAAASLALTAGNSAVGNAVNGVNVNNAGVAGMQAGYGQAASASSAAGGLYNQAAASAQRAADTSAQLWSNLGTAAGTAASRWSDENLKEDVTEGDPDAALAEVTATPIKNWRYAPAALAKEGISMPADEMGENVGPMAQQANATMGEKVAPGGKQLNMHNLVGKALLSVQALDKKVAGLAAMIQKGQLQGAAL